MKIVVVGLLPSQEHVVRKAFPGLRLKFVKVNAGAPVNAWGAVPLSL